MVYWMLSCLKGETYEKWECGWAFKIVDNIWHECMMWVDSEHRMKRVHVDESIKRNGKVRSQYAGFRDGIIIGENEQRSFQLKLAEKKNMNGNGSRNREWWGEEEL